MCTMDWRDIVERRIQEAQERGQFADLPGRGKPLHLRENPFVKREWRLAYRVLENAGFAPDWIELDKTIRTEMAECQKLLRGQLAWANKVLSSRDDKNEIAAELDDMYHWTIARYTRRARELNKKIELFSLMVPVMHLQKHKVRIVEELRRFRNSWSQRTKDLGESIQPRGRSYLKA